MDTRPFEAWALDHGSAVLIHRGETKGECDRVLGPHKTAIVARDGKVFAEKGRDKTALKALRVAMERDWRSKPEAPAPEATTAHAPVPEPAAPAPEDPTSTSEPEAQEIEAPAATCSRCHAAPPGRPTVRTRAGEESWCVGCRRQSAPRSARREAPPRLVATSGREVTITLPADSDAARALAVADRVGGVAALERLVGLILDFVEGA